MIELVKNRLYIKAGLTNASSILCEELQQVQQESKRLIILKKTKNSEFMVFGVLFFSIIMVELPS